MTRHIFSKLLNKCTTLNFMDLGFVPFILNITIIDQLYRKYPAAINCLVYLTVIEPVMRCLANE